MINGFMNSRSVLSWNQFVCEKEKKIHLTANGLLMIMVIM